MITRKRLSALLTGFAFAHAVNGGLGMVYTLAQTLVFARVLDTGLFAQTIAIAAIGIYSAPLNQAVARANFVLLRERCEQGDVIVHVPEAAAAFQISQAIMLALTIVGPLLLGVDSLLDYITLTSFLVFSIYSNIWNFEMQMTMIATGHALLFEWLTLTRKILQFGLLIWLWFGGSFLHVSLTLALTTLAFNGYLMIRMSREGDMFGIPRGLNRGDVRAHLVRFWVSLQATFGEWLSLSGPYALFTAKFGVGHGLIAIDAMMKLVRTCVTISRNLSEIVLMRISRAISIGNAKSASRFVLLALGGGWAAALLLGAVSFFDQRLLFDALLGPNNILPVGAGQAIAVAMFSGCAFVIGSHLVGHTGAPSSVRRIMLSVVGLAVVLTASVSIAPSVLISLWLVAAALSVAGLVALVELRRLVSAEPSHLQGGEPSLDAPPA